MSNKAKRTQLAARSNQAFKILQDNRFHERCRNMEAIGEYALALLLLWVRIEILLKLLKYYDKMEEGWPKILKGIDKRWKPLKELSHESEAHYQLILNHKNNQSLRKLRNQIVHQGDELTEIQYRQYKEMATWVYKKLRDKLKDRKSYLVKKRKMEQKKIS